MNSLAQYIKSWRDEGWRKDAACWPERTGMTPAQTDALFYAEHNATDSLEDAQAICHGCPAWRECLAEGMKEEAGVWGGTTEAERESVLMLYANLPEELRRKTAYLNLIRLVSARIPKSEEVAC